MKYFCGLLLLLFFTLTFFSCSKKNSPTPAPTIVGKWYVKKIVSVLYDNNVQTSNYSSTNYTTADYILFNSDGTGNISKSDTTDAENGDIFGYSVTGKQLIVDEYQKNAITVRDTLTITTLTQSSLTWHNVSIYAYAGDTSKIVEDEYLSK